jgi:hypothetical protein
MILRLAALALFAITLAAIQSTRVSQAITLPATDLGCFARCTGDPSQNSGDPQLLPGRQLKTEGAASAVATCADTAAPECANRESGDRWSNTREGEDYLAAMLSTENQAESKAFDVTIQIRDWDVSPGLRSCTNLGGQAHSPGEDCSNVEAGSDYTEAISVLTVAIIAMLILAGIPFAWVMHRSYRTWRLRRRGAVGKFGPVMR